MLFVDFCFSKNFEKVRKVKIKLGSRETGKVVSGNEANQEIIKMVSYHKIPHIGFLLS